MPVYGVLLERLDIYFDAKRFDPPPTPPLEQAIRKLGLNNLNIKRFGIHEFLSRNVDGADRLFMKYKVNGPAGWFSKGALLSREAIVMRIEKNRWLHTSVDDRVYIADEPELIMALQVCLQLQSKNASGLVGLCIQALTQNDPTNEPGAAGFGLGFQPGVGGPGPVVHQEQEEQKSDPKPDKGKPLILEPADPQYRDEGQPNGGVPPDRKRRRMTSTEPQHSPETPVDSTDSARYGWGLLLGLVTVAGILLYSWAEKRRQIKESEEPESDLDALPV